MKIALALVALVIIAAIVRVITDRKEFAHSFSANRFLMSDCELKFYKILVLAIRDTEVVFSKVRQADIFTPDAAKNSKRFWVMFNTISKRHVDFVICDKRTSEIRAIIELNDKSHGSDKQIRRDSQLKAAAESAKVKLITIKALNAYSPAAIEDLIYGDAHVAGVRPVNATLQK